MLERFPASCHLSHPVHHDPGQHAPALSIDLHHDDAGALRVLRLRKPELQPQIHHRDHLAAKIDHPFDVRRHLRHRRDVLQPHDFPDLQNSNPELLAPQLEHEVLSGPLSRLRLNGRVVAGNGRRWHTLSFLLILLADGFAPRTASTLYRRTGRVALGGCREAVAGFAVPSGRLRRFMHSRPLARGKCCLSPFLSGLSGPPETTARRCRPKRCR